MKRTTKNGHGSSIMLKMNPQMFRDIRNVMDNQIWAYQQDCDKALTARTSLHFLQQSAPHFIAPEDWPSKSRFKCHGLLFGASH